MRATLSLVAGLLAYFAACVSGAQAQEAQWTLVESTGPVFVAQPLAAPRLVSLQEKLGPGSTLTTGGNGRAVVRRGAQNITIGPNSRIALPAADAGGMTKIIQDFGAAMFKVDKRGVQHFEVDTPMIAAVVKGTTFTVSVGANSHSVHVVEGLVEVSTHSGGPAVPVPAGATALVNQANPAVIELRDSSSSGNLPRKPDMENVAPERTPERRANVSDTSTVASLAIPQAIGAGPLNFERLSNGLVGSTSAATAAQRVDARSALTQESNAETNSQSPSDSKSDVLRSVESSTLGTGVSTPVGVLADGNINAIGAITVDRAIASGNGNDGPVIGTIPIGNLVDKAIGNDVVSVMLSGGPVDNAGGNGNGNPGAPVIPAGSPVESAIANANGDSVMAAILARGGKMPAAK